MLGGKMPGGKRNALAWFSKVAGVCLAVFFGLLTHFGGQGSAHAIMLGEICGLLGVTFWSASKRETERPSGWVPDGMQRADDRPGDFDEGE